MEAAFQDVVQELRADGRSVLLSSHILSEVEALCDRVTIIRAGRAAETGTFAELRHLTRTSVVVDTGTPIGSRAVLPGVHDLTVDGCHAEFSVDADQLDRVLAALVRHHIRTLTSSPPTLEELFIRHYDDDAAARPARPQPAGVR
jgi:ABC-2 type transport system ATP-binding protein